VSCDSIIQSRLGEHLGALKSLRAWDTVACICDSGLRHGVLIES